MLLLLLLSHLLLLRLLLLQHLQHSLLHLAYSSSNLQAPDFDCFDQLPLEVQLHYSLLLY
jgi:hypothetical protein